MGKVFSNSLWLTRTTFNVIEFKSEKFFRPPLQHGSYYSFHFFCRVSVLFDSDLLVWQHIYSFAMCHRHGEDNYHMSPKVNYHSQRLDPYICTSNGCPVVCLGWSLGYSAIDRYVQNVSIQTDTNNCDNHSTICIRAVFTIWCRWRNTIPGCNHEFTCHYRFYDIMEEE